MPSQELDDWLAKPLISKTGPKKSPFIVNHVSLNIQNSESKKLYDLVANLVPPEDIGFYGQWMICEYFGLPQYTSYPNMFISGMSKTEVERNVLPKLVEQGFTMALSPIPSVIHHSAVGIKLIKDDLFQCAIMICSVKEIYKVTEEFNSLHKIFYFRERFHIHKSLFKFLNGEPEYFNFQLPHSLLADLKPVYMAGKIKYAQHVSPNLKTLYKGEPEVVPIVTPVDIEAPEDVTVFNIPTTGWIADNDNSL